MQEMKLTEFKNKKPPELIAYAESLEVENGEKGEIVKPVGNASRSTDSIKSGPPVRWIEQPKRPKTHPSE